MKEQWMRLMIARRIAARTLSGVWNCLKVTRACPDHVGLFDWDALNAAAVAEFLRAKGVE
jgi:hypothetical protein